MYIALFLSILYKGELCTRNNYSVIHAFIMVFRGQKDNLQELKSAIYFNLSPNGQSYIVAVNKGELHINRYQILFLQSLAWSTACFLLCSFLSFYIVGVCYALTDNPSSLSLSSSVASVPLPPLAIWPWH